MFQEFPKCLYVGGSVDAVFCVVLDADEEQSARDEGYASVGEPQEKAEVEAESKPKAKAK